MVRRWIGQVFNLKSGERAKVLEVRMCAHQLVDLKLNVLGREKDGPIYLTTRELELNRAG